MAGSRNSGSSKVVRLLAARALVGAPRLLSDTKPLPFVACKGALQFFTPPDEVLHQIELLETQS
jgi:hypothetical protein